MNENTGNLSYFSSEKIKNILFGKRSDHPVAHFIMNIDCLCSFEILTFSMQKSREHIFFFFNGDVI